MSKRSRREARIANARLLMQVRGWYRDCAFRVPGEEELQNGQVEIMPGAIVPLSNGGGFLINPSRVFFVVKKS